MVFNARKSGSPYYDVRVDDQDQYDDSGAKGWKSDRLGALSLVAAILHATLYLSVYIVRLDGRKCIFLCVCTLHIDSRKMWCRNVQSACLCVSTS